MTLRRPAELGDATVAPRSTALLTARNREAECRIAITGRDRLAHWRIRHQVFVEEQLIFTDSDLDAYDADERTVLCVGTWDGVAVGAVRLYPTDPLGRRWQGDRLAVLPAYRTAGVGAPLVKFAVATARELGGHEMSAHIQVPNVRFFEHLGWTRDGAQETYVGVPHQPMVIRWGSPSR